MTARDRGSQLEKKKKQNPNKQTQNKAKVT